MFNFFKTKPKTDEIWIYSPKFVDTDRGASVKILEVGKDAVKIKSISGYQFKEYISMDAFLASFKKFK